MKKYKAIIVDDEVHGRENLLVLVNENLSNIEVVGTAKDAFEAKMLIDKFCPDIVFSDINMGKVNGIDLISSFEGKKFETIFVTAYDKYAIEALRAGASGYLLKPIITQELIDEVNRICEHINNKGTKNDTEHLATESEKKNLNEKYSDNIIINHSKGYFFINVSDIIYLEASGNYCKIFLNTGETITTSKTMKNVSELLNPDVFVRIHKTYIINLNFVKEYKSLGDGSVILKNDMHFKVAVLKRALFKQKAIAFMNINE